MTNGPGRFTARTFFNSLVSQNAQGDITGELAEKWTFPDPTTLEFTLREGVKFHDGTDFNASAVKFSIERIKSINGSLATDMKAITSIEIPNESTVRLRLSAPDVAMLSRLSGKSAYMVSPTAVEKLGKEFAIRPVGTGPFEFVSFAKSDATVTKRFEGYWAKDEEGVQLPYLDGVTYRFIPDDSVRWTALRTGQIDIAPFTRPTDVAGLRADPSLNGVDEAGQLWYLRFCGVKPPFDNRALRQAVMASIDREALHQAIWLGQGEPGRYLYSEKSAAGWALDTTAFYDVPDLAKARAKLAEGGQPNGFNCTIITYDEFTDQIAQAIAGQVGRVGIQMSIERLTKQAGVQRRAQGAYDVSISETSRYGDPSEQIALWVMSGASLNVAQSFNYSNSMVDELLRQAISTDDRALRASYYKKAQVILTEDCPLACIHADAQIRPMGAYVQGYTSTADGWPGFLDRVWIEK